MAASILRLEPALELFVITHIDWLLSLATWFKCAKFLIIYFSLLDTPSGPRPPL